MTIAGDVLLLGGVFLIAVTAVGLLRLPDFYSRAHAVSKTETLGLGLVLLGLVFHEGFTLLGLKLVLVFIFAVLANPLAAHLLTRVAVRRGLDAWTTGAPESPVASARERQ